MRKLLVISLISNVVLVLGLLSKKEPARAEGGGRGGGTPSGNGDVNGDAKLDLTDAVYILQYLFLGGPEVVPIASTGSGSLATGQIQCYDAVGGEIACDSTEWPGQDGHYRLGCPAEGRFVDNQDGTVSDNCTGLMWQKDTADANGNGTSGGEDHLTWESALEYCDGVSFAGHDDWRLPNVQELLGIVDYGRFSPSIDPTFAARSAFYWTSSTHGFDPAFAWHVDFIYGMVNYGHKPGNVFIRAVRGGQ